MYLKSIAFFSGEHSVSQYLSRYKQKNIYLCCQHVNKNLSIFASQLVKRPVKLDRFALWTEIA